MNINWKDVLTNKATLLALIGAAVAFVYVGLGLFGVTPAVGQDAIINWLGMGVSILAILGIVTNPATPGVGDAKDTVADAAEKQAADAAAEKRVD